MHVNWQLFYKPFKASEANIDHVAFIDTINSTITEDQNCDLTEDFTQLEFNMAIK